MSAITDVGGIRVGHHQRVDPDVALGSGWASGTTVVLTPPGTVGAVDCRGGAPGTRETDLLDPINAVQHVDAVVLSGGSAYGLAAADGVMRWLEEHDRGVAMEGGVVPIVPAAVVFDLPVGGWQCRPTAEFGYAAAESAAEDVAIGTVGAGTGARVGVLKGGVGTASVMLESGVTVGALVVVNSAGDAVDPRPACHGLLPDRGVRPRRPAGRPGRRLRRPAHRTQPAQHHHRRCRHRRRAEQGGCRRMAVAAQDGLARTIRPCHTPLDGDTVFALATGGSRGRPRPTTPASMSSEMPLITALGAAAADCLARAVLVGVLAAESVAGIPTYRDMLPGAFE